MADPDTVEPSGWEAMHRRATARSTSRVAGNAAAGEVERAFARCFAGADGARVLDHLHAITLDRALGPDADDAALRHLEGQRALILHLKTLIDRGRAPR
jgi:hypothetical protein